jgi:adenosylhomocysteine nucleosidase
LKILAVASEAFECKPWLARCQGAQPCNWPLPFAQQAEWNGNTLYAVANGPGPRLAAEAVEIANKNAGPFDGLMSIGLCGALAENLELQALCTATDVSDGETTFPAQPLEGATPLRLLSIDRFIRTPEEKRAQAHNGFGIVEMEAAAVARFAAENNLPFRAAKVVSDRAGEHFALDFNQYRDLAGRFSKSKIALAALAHPIKFAPDLYRMASRGPSASETLGVFLAKSRF